MSKALDPQFRRADTPPSLGRIVPILRIGEKEARTLVVLSTRLFGVYTHWRHDGKSGRTIRCHSEKRKCVGCKTEMPRRWKGFLCVSDSAGKSVGFLELTPYAGEQFMSLLDDRIDARGMVIFVRRERPVMRAPLLIEQVGEWEQAKPLPAEVSPEKTLIRLWGLATEDC